MNPLLFADWGRLNRRFTQIMWTLAVVLMLVIGVALARTAGTGSRSQPPPQRVPAQMAVAGDPITR